jgi:hypothetical protein
VQLDFHDLREGVEELGCVEDEVVDYSHGLLVGDRLEFSVVYLFGSGLVRRH